MAELRTAMPTERLEGAAIQARLAHRYPFLLVNRIDIVQPGQRLVGTTATSDRRVHGPANACNDSEAQYSVRELPTRGPHVLEGKDDVPASRAAWHVLLAPLPSAAAVRRHPVVPPEISSTPAGAAIAGWESLLVELSAGAAGLRVVQVTIDRSGQLLSASDHVLYRSTHPSDPAAPAHMEQESIGGRFEAEGSFRGTHWHAIGAEPADGAEPEWTMTPRPPTIAEIAGLQAIVAELLRREVA